MDQGHARCGIRCYASGPLSRVRRLPEQKATRDPGELLLTLLLKLDQVRLERYDCLNEAFALKGVKQRIVDGADVIGKKTLLRRRRQEEYRGSERSTMVTARANIAIVKTHFPVGERAGGAFREQRVPSGESGGGPPCWQLLGDPCS